MLQELWSKIKNNYKLVLAIIIVIIIVIVIYTKKENLSNYTIIDTSNLIEITKNNSECNANNEIQYVNTKYNEFKENIKKFNDAIYNKEKEDVLANKYNELKNQLVALKQLIVKLIINDVTFNCLQNTPNLLNFVLS